MPTVKAKRYDADSYQLMYQDEVVALALALADGGWVVADLEGKPLTKRLASPKECARKYDAILEACT